MRKSLILLILPLTFLGFARAEAGNVDIDLNVNIGVPAPVVVIESAPEFILIPTLGFHISIGSPYDIIYLDGSYFLFQHNRWYRSYGYRGPWRLVEPRHLPQRLRKHEYREMLDRRDREYREYQKDRKRYKEKHGDRYYRPDDDRHDRKNGKDREKGGHGHKD